MSLLMMLMGFFSGSILYSAVLPRVLKGIDIRKLSADGNPGAANAFKYGGIMIGTAALLCDLLKAYLPVHFACHLVGMDNPFFALCLCAPVAGHAFSPFAHFKGGKAIAAGFGCLLALLPDCTVIIHLAFWYILFSTLILIRPHAARTILAFALTALAALRQPFSSVAVGILMIFAIVTGRHISSLHADPFSLHLLGFQVWPHASRKEEAATH